MIKNLFLLNFIISITLGLCIYITQKFNIELPWILNNYINDFLIIPIVLTICSFVLKKTRSDREFRISIGIIIYVVVAYALFFELIMPKLSTRYTADFFDLLMYILGGLWFWFSQKKQASIHNN